MGILSTPDPLDNIEHAVALVAKADKSSRRRLVRDLLRGELKYDTPNGALIGGRRALLCTRLREEGLEDDVFVRY